MVWGIVGLIVLVIILKMSAKKMFRDRQHLGLALLFIIFCIGVEPFILMLFLKYHGIILPYWQAFGALVVLDFFTQRIEPPEEEEVKPLYTNNFFK